MTVPNTADDPLDAVLADYFQRLDRGERIAPQALIETHPELADSLREFFDAADFLERLAGPTLAEHTQQLSLLDTSRAAKLGETIVAFGPNATSGNTVGALGAESVVQSFRERKPGEEIPPGEAGAHGGFGSSGESSARGASGPQASESQMFGRYEIERLLGQGAMGSVYLAYDPQLERRVALKIPKFTAEDYPEMSQRFFREARAAATLRHANICPVYDVDQLGGVQYLTMAYIEGRTLADELRGGRQFQPEELARIIRKLAQALAKAHAAGIVHRDIKPGNIMLDADDEPVLMDFGLAYRAENDELRLTRAGTIVGSPAYMSPEQLDGDPAKVGPHSDIYSLGVVLFEMLTGKLPFSGSMMSVIGQIAAKEPPPVGSIRPELANSPLADLCRRMMAKKPHDRPASMQMVADELAAIEAGGASGNTLRGETSAQARPEPRWPQFSLRTLLLAVLLLPPLIAGSFFLLRLLDIRATWWAVAGGALQILLWLVVLAYVLRGKLFDSIVPAKGTSSGAAQKPTKPPHARGAEPAPRHSLAVVIALIVGLASLTCLVPVLGVIVYFATEAGKLQIVSHVDDVTVEIRGENGLVSVVDLDSGSKVHRLPSGEYSIRIKEGPAAATLDKSRFTLRRGLTTVVTATWMPGARASDPPTAPGSPASIPEPPRFGANSEVVPSSSTSRLVEVGRYEGHTEHVTSLAVSGDGKLIVSGSADGTVLAREMETGASRRAFSGHRRDRQVAVAVSRDGNLIVSGDWDGKLRLGRSGAEVTEIEAHAGSIMSVTFSPDETKLLTTGGDNKARIWSVDSLEPLHTLEGAGWVSDGDFSPDGEEVVTAGFDGKIVIWRTADGTQVRELPTGGTMANCVAWAPEGDRISAGFRDGTVRVFSATSAEEKVRLTGHADRVRDVVFTPDGRHLVSGSYDCTMRLWDAETGAELARVESDKHIFNALTVSPDGRHVFSAGGIWKPDEETNEWQPEHDYAIRMWKLPQGVWPNEAPPAQD